MLMLKVNRYLLGMFHRKTALIVVCALFAGGTVFPFNYSEHRALGDSAFAGFMDDILKAGEFKNRDELCAYFEKAAGLKCSETGAPYFAELSNAPNYVSFGVLNGLSGDHEDNPLRLREELMHRYSVMNQMIALNARKNNEFKDNATYSEMMAINPRYPYLAIKNYSHFYNYGDTLEAHLGKIEKNNLKLLATPANGNKVFSDLEHSNALDIYTTLHIFAISMAEKAGILAKTDPERSRLYLSYAFLYEGFCDHFLEDSFASGHIIVRRTLVGGAINNKSMHDFYNKLGLDVMNLNGDVWKAYGDNLLLYIPDQWESTTTYEGIAVTTNPPHAVMARNAVRVSLTEMWEAYRARLDGAPYTSVIDRFPDSDDSDDIEKFALANFKALSYVPVPFGSDLTRYSLPPDRLEELQAVNAPVQSRNFIRSRVANTITATVGSYQEGINGDILGLLGLRLNVMDKANYHDMADKKGSVDSWSGYTASYAAAVDNNWCVDTARLSVGKSYFWDIWVSKRRYFSLYSYMEIGIAREGEVNRFAFSPSIGIQPGSLIGLDNYTMPRWIWTPLQFILPLKVTFGVNLVPHKKPGYSCVGEIDLLF